MGLRIIVVLIVLSAHLGLSAQASRSYKLFQERNDFKPFGLFKGAGIVQTMSDNDVRYVDEISEITSYDVGLTASGRSAPFIEIGGFSIQQYGPVRMIDFGFSYRKVSGTENINGVLRPGSDLSYPDELLLEGDFVHHRTAFRMNLNVVKPIGANSFFHTGPGLSARMTIKLKEDYDLGFLDLKEKSDIAKTAASLNYLAGIGWKVAPGKFLNLYCYTSVANFERKGFRSTEPIFNSEFRLMTIGLRFLFLKPSTGHSCPTYLGSSSKAGRLPSSKGRSGDHPW